MTNDENAAKHLLKEKGHQMLELISESLRKDSLTPEQRQKLEKIIKEALADLGIDESVFTVEHPAELAHGDYATNAAMAAGKSAGSPDKTLLRAARPPADATRATMS